MRGAFLAFAVTGVSKHLCNMSRQDPCHKAELMLRLYLPAFPTSIQVS